MEKRFRTYLYQSYFVMQRMVLNLREKCTADLCPYLRRASLFDALNIGAHPEPRTESRLNCQQGRASDAVISLARQIALLLIG